jgi:hypothetical protein
MMELRRAGSALLVVSAVFMAGVTVAEADQPQRSRRSPRATRTETIEAITQIDNLRRMDVNRINMYMTNYGSFAWDLTTGNPGLYFPKGTTKSAVFAGGLWLGASVGGEIRTVVAEYSQEYGPGAMVSGTFDNPSRPEYRTYKVVRFSGDRDDTAHVERDANEATYEDPLVHHSWSEYIRGAAPYGAPTRMYRLPPPEGAVDSVDVLGPDVLGDMMMWSVYNDANPARHTNDAGGSDPLGIEIQQTTFAFNRQGALGNIIFLKYLIINKGGQQLDSMFVSLWSDPDLGGAADDLVGVDTTLSLGYTYNSTNNDQLYGSAPPAVGYDFFLGPINAAGDTLPMTSFNKYINGTDPASTSDTYNYMNGFLPDGSEVIDPTTGLATKFFHPGDPTTLTGWLDSNPADRRHLLTSGPFRMAPGDTQTVVAALIIGDGNDRLSSISAMKFYDEFAQLAFDEGFQLPSPPQQPRVAVDVDHERITLSWNPDARLNYFEPGYTFEGYNIYQGESIAGPWRRLATFDEINGILTVRDTIFDLETGRTISDYPVAFGTDAGVRYTYTTTLDQVRGGNLHDGTEYYFAVTAYAVSFTEKLAVVENAQQAIPVIPQRPALGTDPGTASALPVLHSYVDSSGTKGTDVVEVTVVDPAAVNGHSYRVVFTPVSPPYPVFRGDTITTAVWNLIDVTTGDTLLKNQVNKTGDEDYQVIAGLLIKVRGAYEPALQEITYRNLVTDNRTALQGVAEFAMPYFGGGGNAGCDFFGSTICPTSDPDSFTTVQIRLSTTETQKAYRFVRLETASGGAPTSYPDRGYLNRGFVDVPFQVWDATNEVQLDAAFLEKEVTDNAGVRLPDNQQTPTTDSTWAPAAVEEDVLGGREYIFVYRRPYSDTPKAELAVDGSVLAGTVPVLYAIAPRYRSVDDVIDDGDQIEAVWASPATANDVYDFSTTTLVRGNQTFATGKLDRIRAVPNPYYNRSRYELNQFARVIRFINMPENATVRIFNLSGALVRTLQKTEIATSILEWNLLTDNELPVASGVYIFHVEAPGVGSTFGRMVVFMEKERLNNF